MAGALLFGQSTCGYHAGVLTLLLLLAAAICFASAAFGVGARVNLVALGLLFWVLTALIPAL